MSNCITFLSPAIKSKAWNKFVKWITAHSNNACKHKMDQSFLKIKEQQDPMIVHFLCHQLHTDLCSFFNTMPRGYYYKAELCAYMKCFPLHCEGYNPHFT